MEERRGEGKKGGILLFNGLIKISQNSQKTYNICQIKNTIKYGHYVYKIYHENQLSTNKHINRTNLY